MLFFRPCHSGPLAESDGLNIDRPFILWILHSIGFILPDSIYFVYPKYTISSLPDETEKASYSISLFYKNNLDTVKIYDIIHVDNVKIGD
jgi:hypothetical protein